MNINDYSKSREEYLRACKVIPSGIYGHQGPAEGCYTPVEASRALAQVRGQSDSANELVRLALRGMAGL